MGIEKNKDTAESKKFWEVVEDSSACVSSWPAWKREGWEVKRLTKIVNQKRRNLQNIASPGLVTDGM